MARQRGRLRKARFHKTPYCGELLELLRLPDLVSSPMFRFALSELVHSLVR
jgi:hypothetical protein